MTFPDKLALIIEYRYFVKITLMSIALGLMPQIYNGLFSGRGFFGPLEEMVGVKMMVLLEAARHATPQQSKRHRL
jgi:hypothetical protein